tara:strand:- start:3722 stop:3919 length:198 start_codon:yes stop_codon:yes gene_type:complete
LTDSESGVVFLITIMSLEMKRYEFWVTLPNEAPMKVVEEGRTASEAMRIVQSKFPDAKVLFAKEF